MVNRLGSKSNLLKKLNSPEIKPEPKISAYQNSLLTGIYAGSITFIAQNYYAFTWAIYCARNFLDKN